MARYNPFWALWAAKVQSLRRGRLEIMVDVLAAGKVHRAPIVSRLSIRPSFFPWVEMKVLLCYKVQQ